MSDRRDPYRGYNFKLEIDGITRAAFREVSGLDAAEPARRLPGQTKYSNITLKWGVTDDHSLLKWGDTAIDGKTERRNGSIILMEKDAPVKVWKFKNAWPIKWTGPSLNATAEEVAIETLEIEHEGLTEG
jgi:phage tail-like protein